MASSRVVRYCWLFLALALTGCTGSTGSAVPVVSVMGAPAAAASTAVGSGHLASTTPSTSASAIPTVTVAWTASGVVPLSKPVAVGGSFVLYARHAGRLVLVGLDPANGRMRWEQKASAGVHPDGTMSPSASDNRVAYLRPGGSDPLRSTLVVADGATGADLVQTRSGFFYSGLGTCSGPDTQGWIKAGLCGWRRTAEHGEWSNERVQVNLRTGGTTAPTTTDDEYTGVAGLQEEWLDQDRWLMGVPHGTQRWAHPLADYIGRAGTVGRLEFRQVNRVVVATAFLAQPSAVTPTSTVYDLPLGTGVITFALDLDSGKLLWKMAGAAADCLDDDSLSVRCRYSGHARVTVGGDGTASVTASGLGVTLEHFDPRSGRILWSAALGSVPGLIPLPADTTVDRRPAALAAGVGRRMLALGPAAPTVVDLGTGRVAAPTPGEVFWCPVVSSGSATAVRAGGIEQACNAHGRPAEASGPSVPAAAGATIRTGVQVFRAVSGPGSVTGYLLLPHDPSTAAVAASAASAAGTPTTAVVGAATRRLTRAWSNSDLRPVTAPVVVGGTAVYYGTSGSLLYLVGLDPQTGRQRWRVLASMAFLDEDDGLSVHTFGGKVLYYESSGINLYAFLDALDPATGKSVRLTQAQAWDTQPSPCSNSVTEVCAQARHGVEAGSSDGEFAIDVAHGTVRDHLDTSGPVGWRSLFNTIYQQGTGESGALASFHGATRIWQKSLGELFGAGTTNVRWYTVHWTDTDFELTVLKSLSKDASGHWRPLSLATQVVTVDFSRATGQVRWRSPGTALGCFARLSGAGAGPADLVGDLACRYIGTAADPDHTGSFSHPDHVGVTLERFDPVSGAVLWSRSLGQAAELETPFDTVPLTWASAGKVALHTDSGAKVVDVGTGTVRSAARTDVFWCERETSFAQDETYWANDQPVTTRSGSGVVEPCRRAGSAVDASPPALSPAAVSSGDTDMVSTPEGVLGFRWIG